MRAFTHNATAAPATVSSEFSATMPLGALALGKAAASTDLRARRPAAKPWSRVKSPGGVHRGDEAFVPARAADLLARHRGQSSIRSDGPRSLRGFPCLSPILQPPSAAPFWLPIFSGGRCRCCCWRRHAWSVLPRARSARRRRARPPTRSSFQRSRSAPRQPRNRSPTSAARSRSSIRLRSAASNAAPCRMR